MVKEEYNFSEIVEKFSEAQKVRERVIHSRR